MSDPSSDSIFSPDFIPPGSQLEKQGIIIPRGPQGSWDDGMVECPMVWWDPRQNAYGLVHTGYKQIHPERQSYEAVGKPQIGLAWSKDLFHWEKDERSPIFGPEPQAASYDRSGCSGPLIWLQDEVYYLFYFGTTEEGYEGGRKALNVAQSSDLIHWERFAGNPIIEPAGEGWRREAIWHPHIQKVAGTYYLFFNASGQVNGLDEEFIGYATSQDLLHWEVQDTDCPLLVGSRIPGHWDSSGRTGDPSLYRVGDTWYMAYYSWDQVHTQDGLAATTREAFPRGWKPFVNNPILAKGRNGAFDALHAGKPFVYRTEHQHLHFYTAVDDQGVREIALATGNFQPLAAS